MDIETAEFLLSPEGGQLLAEARPLEGSFLARLTTLRKKYPGPIAGAALELLDLRKRAEKKFTHASEMFFTREALEQASSETVSTYRAQRFEKDSHILDLACGIGGDTIGLARRCFVTAVDRDPVRLAMARRNLEVYGLADRVEFVCTDVTQITLKADAAFLDPSRRTEGRRVVKLSQLNPPLEFIHRLTESIPDSAVKLSPAADYQELEALGGEIEFISERGECKEALVWFGRFKTISRRATILPGPFTMEYQPVPEIPALSPGRYLFEPDPCIIRAHLVQNLAHQMGAWKIDPLIAYLSSDEPVANPFAVMYEVIEVLPFNMKAVHRRLMQLDAGKIIVKKRGVPFDPVEIEHRLKVDGRREIVLVLTRVSEKPHALICLRAGFHPRGGE